MAHKCPENICTKIWPALKLHEGKCSHHVKDGFSFNKHPHRFVWSENESWKGAVPPGAFLLLLRGMGRPTHKLILSGGSTWLDWIGTYRGLSEQRSFVWANRHYGVTGFWGQLGLRGLTKLVTCPLTFSVWLLKLPKIFTFSDSQRTPLMLSWQCTCAL